MPFGPRKIGMGQEIGTAYRKKVRSREDDDVSKEDPPEVPFGKK